MGRRERTTRRKVARRVAAALGRGAPLLGAALPAIALGAPGMAETVPAPTLNFYGVAGLIDMPSGEAMPDGEFSVTVSRFAGITRGTLTFQFAPWLSGSFRYIGLQDWNFGGFDTYYDRNFDVRITPLKEGPWWPALTIGLQDFAGTGRFSGEYIAATKTVVPGVALTGGLGWGRLAGRDAIGAIGTRPSETARTGGKFNPDQWFRGDVSVFGGIEWRPSDRLGIKLEYSTDTYDLERERGLFDQSIPVNIGVEYQASESFRLGAYYLYGSELGFSVQISLNPKRPPTLNTQEPGGIPFKPRPSPAANPDAWSRSWAESPARKDRIVATLDTLLKADGMGVESLTLTGDRATLYLRNRRFPNAPQAIVRAARTLTQVLPPSVEVFDIVPVQTGMPVSKVTMRRSDLEATEFSPDAAAALRARVAFSDPPVAPALGSVRPEDLYPAFRYSFGPYTRFSFFDPNEPIRGEVGARAGASYEFAPGLTLSGTVSKRVTGNLHVGRRASTSQLPHVRSDAYLYDREGDPSIDRLQLSYVRHPFANIYTRLSAGYLERMYAGVSGEVLWKPVDSRLALGVELNAVRQRDFNLMLGLRDYDVVTGHVSAYYDLGQGYRAQIDVGRYLARDVGATISLDREFANGWKVGAFATFTDVSAEQFGEGSFDKGIRLVIPFSWILGEPTQTDYATVIKPLSRDGGSRLNVSGRLYETVRPYHEERLDAQWGKAWR